MDRFRDAGWRKVIDPALGLRFRYPVVTPRGARVDRVSEHGSDADRVHLAGGNGEVYVEIVRFRDLAPRDEYARHRARLERRFGPQAVTELCAAELRNHTAMAYAFRWDEGERSVLLLPVEADTYQIIIDPRSPLNEEILASVVVDG
jgi:hypothetical protein